MSYRINVQFFSPVHSLEPLHEPLDDRVALTFSCHGYVTASRTAAAATDIAALVGRSAIILQRPNTQAAEAMPLGNGRLGLAVWAAEGLTIQLNRADTLPGRLSPRQIVLPGLERMDSAKDYSARLNFYGSLAARYGHGREATGETGWRPVFLKC